MAPVVVVVEFCGNEVRIKQKKNFEDEK